MVWVRPPRVSAIRGTETISPYERYQERYAVEASLPQNSMNAATIVEEEEIPALERAWHGVAWGMGLQPGMVVPRR